MFLKWVFAEKAASYHPDALIAVTSEAGGHCGNISPEVFIPQTREGISQYPNNISAGGVTKKSARIDKMISLGACGVSVGTVFYCFQ
jgi:nitronate monooxygenase